MTLTSDSTSPGRPGWLAEAITKPLTLDKLARVSKNLRGLHDAEGFEWKPHKKKITITWRHRRTKCSAHLLTPTRQTADKQCQRQASFLPKHSSPSDLICSGHRSRPLPYPPWVGCGPFSGRVNICHLPAVVFLINFYTFSPATSHHPHSRPFRSWFFNNFPFDSQGQCAGPVDGRFVGVNIWHRRGRGLAPGLRGPPHRRGYIRLTPATGCQLCEYKINVISSKSITSKGQRIVTFRKYLDPF